MRQEALLKISGVEDRMVNTELRTIFSTRSMESIKSKNSVLELIEQLQAAPFSTVRINVTQDVQWQGEIRDFLLNLSFDRIEKSHRERLQTMANYI